jgi:hypothetical protein
MASAVTASCGEVFAGNCQVLFIANLSVYEGVAKTASFLNFAQYMMRIPVFPVVCTENFVMLEKRFKVRMNIVLTK